MSRAVLTILLALTTLAVVNPVPAHHSFAMFDMQKQLTLSGTVKDFQFSNPHSFIQLLVTDGASQVEWSIEMGSPLDLYRRGWRVASLKPGDKIRVVIHPSREGNSGSLVSATGPDGTPIAK